MKPNTSGARANTGPQHPRRQVYPLLRLSGVQGNVIKKRQIINAGREQLVHFGSDDACEIKKPRGQIPSRCEKQRKGVEERGEK